MTSADVSWLEVVSFGLSALGGTFAAWVKWTAHQTFAPKGLVERVATIETRMEGLPHKEDIHAVAVEIAGLRGDIKTFGAALKGLEKLLDRVEDQVTRHEGIFAEGRR